ncbi:MAG: diaminopimelate decarboxylase [Opitutae bacterium]|nr:diaminopimelate decarboxylase [Opitutae bacterium]
MEKLRFLTSAKAREAREKFGTPLFIYDEATLKAQAESALAFPNAFGLTARFAMKASPNAAILRLFKSLGIQIDASSIYEVERAIRAGFLPNEISLSTQELGHGFAELLKRGVHINACSIAQLKKIGEACPGSEIGVRFNPGLGSGSNNRTNVGGPASSFGIWYEKIDEIKNLLQHYGLKVICLHTHIGSGSDPSVWSKVALMSLDLVREFPDVHTLDLGGGYKIGRMNDEKSTNLQEIGQPVKEAFLKFADETGRQIHLEIEPGTFLAANACTLLSSIQDTTDTGSDGYSFLKLDTGMTEVLRPSLYGAQHPIITIPDNPEASLTEYIVCGHCCESGDILTPAPDQPEVLQPRKLLEADIGDLCAIEGVGAYCAAMPAKNYNSFPEAAEALHRETGELQLIRSRQTLDQILQNEVAAE